MRGLLVVAVLELAACGFSVSGAGSGDGSIDVAGDGVRPDGTPGAARRRVITVDPIKVTGNQAGFPMWFTIEDAQLGSAARADGADLYFTNPSGEALPFEIQRWDKASGHLDAWVLVSLDDLLPTLLELRYGDPGAAQAPSGAAVFAAPFAAVWHFEDALTTTAIQEARGVVPGTAIGGMTSAQHVAGTLGSAISFDGVNDEIQFTNPILGSTAHTFSAWVNAEGPAGGSFSSILVVGNPSNSHARWWHTSYPEISMGFYNMNDFITNINVDGSKHLLHWVSDTNVNVSRLYRDGELVATSTPYLVANDTQGNGGHIGNAPQQFGPGGNNPCPLQGTLDEVRLAKVARSAGWIATEFANQSAPQSFYSVGAALPVP